MTLWATACDGVWLGNEAREAPADGVTVTVWSTGCSWSTGTGLAGVPHRASYLRTGVRLETLWTLAEGPALLGDTHGVLPAGVGVAGVGDNTALLGGGIRDQALGTLAG